MLLSLQRNGKTICTAFIKLFGRMKLVDLTNGLITISHMTVCQEMVNLLVLMQLLKTLRILDIHTIGGVFHKAVVTKFTQLTQLASQYNLMDKPPTHLLTAHLTVPLVNLMMDAVDREFAMQKML